MSIDIKKAKNIERHLKGVANHRRISIIFLISEREGLSLDAISEALDCNIKTISEHTRRLFQAGLINKKYKGREVCHSLSPYGKKFVKFLKSF